MQNNPGKLISILYRKAQMFWNQSLREYGISSAEYPVLIKLFQKDGVTQEEIANELDIDKSAITRVIRSLLDKGFIEKKKDEVDRRCNHIFLTEKGWASRKPINMVKKQWNEILMKNMEPTEKETLSGLLLKSVQNIKTREEE